MQYNIWSAANLLVVLTVMKRVERTDLTPAKDRDRDGRTLTAGSSTLHKDRLVIERTDLTPSKDRDSDGRTLTAGSSTLYTKTG